MSVMRRLSIRLEQIRQARVIHGGLATGQATVHYLSGLTTQVNFANVQRLVFTPGADASYVQSLFLDVLGQPGGPGQVQSLVALWLSQLIVFAVYPLFARRRHQRALPAWLLAGAGSGLAIYGLVMFSLGGWLITQPRLYLVGASLELGMLLLLTGFAMLSFGLQTRYARHHGAPPISGDADKLMGL